jgi:hypothetical protein
MKAPATRCRRCGREVRGQSGDLCAPCEAANQKATDAKFKRQQRAEREAKQNAEGGWTWRW